MHLPKSVGLDCSAHQNGNRQRREWQRLQDRGKEETGTTGTSFGSRSRKNGERKKRLIAACAFAIPQRTAPRIAKPRRTTSRPPSVTRRCQLLMRRALTVFRPRPSAPYPGAPWPFVL